MSGGGAFIVRRARPDEYAALAAFKRRTFRETFVDGELAVGYSPQNLSLFEAQSYGEAVIAAELADPARAQWVAQAADGALAGYAHAGPCKLPHARASRDQGELYQLYVADSWQGRGVGRALLDMALGWLGDAMPGPQWIGVYSGNLKAQTIYAARGFVKVGEYEFMVGDHRDHEFILRRG